MIAALRRLRGRSAWLSSRNHKDGCARPKGLQNRPSRTCDDHVSQLFLWHFVETPEKRPEADVRFKTELSVVLGYEVIVHWPRASDACHGTPVDDQLAAPSSREVQVAGRTGRDLRADCFSPPLSERLADLAEPHRAVGAEDVLVTFDRPHARFPVSVPDDDVEWGRRRTHAEKCRGQRHLEGLGSGWR